MTSLTTSIHKKISGFSPSTGSQYIGTQKTSAHDLLHPLTVLPLRLQPIEIFKVNLTFGIPLIHLFSQLSNSPQTDSLYGPFNSSAFIPFLGCNFIFSSYTSSYFPVLVFLDVIFEVIYFHSISVNKTFCALKNIYYSFLS